MCARRWQARREGAGGWICWQAAKAAGESAGELLGERLAEELEMAPGKERKKLEREARDAGKRVERRARARALDRGLQLAELWLRDMMCVREGAEELVYAVDRMGELEADAKARGGASARGGVELVRETQSADRAERGRGAGARSAGIRLQSARGRLRGGSVGAIRRSGPKGAGAAHLIRAVLSSRSGPRFGSRPYVSKARKREKRRLSGPWKSEEPVLSRSSSAQRAARSSVWDWVWVT